MKTSSLFQKENVQLTKTMSRSCGRWGRLEIHSNTGGYMELGHTCAILGAGGGAVRCRQHKYSSSEGFTAQGCVLRLQNCTTNAKFLLQLVLLELVFLWRGLHGGADFGPENESVEPQKLMSCSLHLLEQSSMSMSCPSVANISRMASS